ncbi:amino acid ABC transporter substrate-binding protein [Acuticoccus sp. MNP-M23]|uniref:amino acid ABC transporter substrate-binding protein n=1 Tax=Acuticoccus sp. MNP-M23 TaxID=3072793 RepID=UPI002814E188|nr:amino acid ABC transporter substrate-binding protein [Acuticoccus sp. MNP-M23]WMS41129.1 amino acid ABC transporter substrate-binding protein [Acuticoccus sp. MNP-M23]
MTSIAIAKVARRAALGALLAATSLTPALAQDEDGVLKIGAPLALTGGLADEGKKQEDVWNLWAEKANAAGGVEVGGQTLPVEFVEYDYQTEGNRAGQLAERLITEDNVDVLMAPFGSGHTKIIAAVAERYQVPLIACVASSTSVYDQGFQYLFGTLAPNTGMTESMVAYFKEKMPDISKVAILGRDDVFPKSMATALAASAESAGLDVVYNELYAVGTLDHATAISAIKGAEPDWIYMTGYTQDLILGRKQMQDLGVTAPIITMVTGPAYKEFTEGLGELADGVTSSTWWHHATAYEDATGVWPTTASFYEDFTAKFDTDPDYVHASCAAAADVLVNAVKEAGSTDKQAVRDALAATDILTFYGPIDFGDNGMNQGREMPIIQVQGEGIKVLYPANIADADLTAVE